MLDGVSCYNANGAKFVVDTSPAHASTLWIFLKLVPKIMCIIHSVDLFYLQCYATLFMKDFNEIMELVEKCDGRSCDQYFPDLVAQQGASPQNPDAPPPSQAEIDSYQKLAEKAHVCLSMPYGKIPDADLGEIDLQIRKYRNSPIASLTFIMLKEASVTQIKTPTFF